MINFLKNYGIYGLIIIALRALGLAIDKSGVWDYLTVFFVTLRTLVKPLDFMWDFGTSYLLINLCLSLLILVYGFKAVMLVKGIFDK